VIDPPLATSLQPPNKFPAWARVQEMANETSAVRAQEPTPLAIAIRDRSWDWLLELRRRLKVDLLLVDTRLAALWPTASGDQPAHVVALLERRDPTIVEGFTDALKERVARVIEVEGLQIACIPLTGNGVAPAALLLARGAPARQNLMAARSQLEMVGTWLSTAIEAHLLSPPVFQASGLNRVAPLAQLLGRAAERESDRELIRLFGEAIAVWHDIEVCSYAETSSGSFARDVMLPGSRRGDRPALIPAVDLPESTDLTRLPQGHLERFGPVHGDVFVKRFQHGEEGSWLLVFIGVIDTFDQYRLGAYVALLELALALSAATISAKVSAAVTQRLTDEDGTNEARARQALEELRTSVGAASATLVLSDAAGNQRLRVIAPVGAADSEAHPGTFRVVLVKRSERHYTTTVALGRHESLLFTPRDSTVVRRAVEAFGAWATLAFRSAPDGRERRSAARGFPEVLERSAREAVSRGFPVAVVVLVVHHEASRHESTQRWVAGMRGQMRATDMAGMLGEGEIGLLMYDTQLDQAKNIAERLRAMITGVPGGESIAIGVAARHPGQQGSVEGIVHDARARAVAASRISRASVSPHGGDR